ncbi:MAG: 30S ribosomal protein S2 [Patescibacteria group bacterium]|nr:30S ribosomal protein S2 [Patescibacteria group bacterium]
MAKIKETNLEELLSAAEKEAPIEEEKLPILEEMMKVGLFWGHKKSKTHPRMKPFIYTTRNGVEIIDIIKTLESLDKALNFIKSKVAVGGTVMLVGTTPVAKKVVREYAEKMNLPYVVERWLGGTLTNFKTLSKRIAYFKKLKSDKASGKLDKYTKKERLDFDREIAKLTTSFSGTENMEILPQVMFVVDAAHNMIAVNEAKKMKIPVVAIVNTDINPEILDYPIPCNDRTKEGIRWIMEKLSATINEAKLAPKE